MISQAVNLRNKLNEIWRFRMNLQMKYWRIRRNESGEIWKLVPLKISMSMYPFENLRMPSVTLVPH